MTITGLVSARDSSGRVSTVELAAADAGRLAAGVPWRVFRWHRGQAHYSGWYWSATAGGHVVYESRLELARLLLADFDPRVSVIAAQPFCVSAEVDGRKRRHVPDFLLIGADGVVSVVNVKPAGQLAVPEVAEALQWAATVFASRGWRHEIWSGTCPVVLANVRFLAGYRFPDRVDAAAVAQLDRMAAGTVSIGEAEASLAGRFPAGVGRPALLHLVWRGIFRVVLDEPLSAATVLERVA